MHSVSRASEAASSLPRKHERWWSELAVACPTLLSTADQWPLTSDTTDHWLLTTDYWPLTTDRWPLTTDHWPMTTDHWSLATDHWPMTNDRWPMIADHWPLTTDQWYHWPMTTDQWPLTIDQWPMIADHWPLTTDHWSLITDHWPLTTDYWLLTTDNWPVTADHWPITTDQWPLTNDRWPMIADHWPLISDQWLLISCVTLALTCHAGRVSSAHSQLVERQCVHDPVDDVEQSKCQRKHSPRDSVHLTSFLFTFRVNNPRRTSISAALDDVNLRTRTYKITSLYISLTPINHGYRRTGSRGPEASIHGNCLSRMGQGCPTYKAHCYSDSTGRFSQLRWRQNANEFQKLQQKVMFSLVLDNIHSGGKTKQKQRQQLPGWGEAATYNIYNINLARCLKYVTFRIEIQCEMRIVLISIEYVTHMNIELLLLLTSV